MAESFENLDNILHDCRSLLSFCTYRLPWAKDKCKKYFPGIKQVREVWSSRKRQDKAVSFLEKGLEKSFEQPAVERANPNTKWVLRSQEPLLYLELNKLNKQAFMRLIHLINSTFSQSQNNC